MSRGTWAAFLPESLGGLLKPQRPGPSGSGNGHGPTYGPWPHGAARQLCQVLLDVPEIDDPSLRARLLREMGYELGLQGAFPVRDAALASDHVVGIVRGCEDWHDPAAALRALAGAVRFLRPGSAALDWFEAYVSCLTEPYGLLPAERMLGLLEVLRGLRPVPDPLTVNRLVHASLDHPDEQSPVRDGRGLPEAVTRLNQARRGPGTVPLLLRFLGSVAQHAPDLQGAELRRHLKEAAHELGVGEADLWPSERSEHAARSEKPLTGRPMVLQILLDEASPVGTEGDPTYTLEAALYETAEQPWSLIAKYALPRAIPLGQLRTKGARHLVAWPELAATVGSAEDLRVEFLLPWSLLNHPAELWPMDEDDYPVGMHFPVVVRSLDRIRSTLWHRAWRAKWRVLEEVAGRPRRGSLSDHVGWLTLGDGLVPLDAELSGRTLRVGTREGEVRRWLDGRPQTTCLALSFPHTFERAGRPLSHRAVKDAVREGIPVIVWRRDSGSPSELDEFLAELDINRLGDLAGHVHRRRRAATEDDPEDIGNHLSLLWDDPAQGSWVLPTPFAAPGHHRAAASYQQEGQPL